MKTDVTALNEVDYTLDVHVPADEIEPRIVAVLKQQRGQMNLKGFRPGKVPIQVVRKMLGPQVALQVAEEVIGEAYREAVGEAGTYDLVGPPRLAELDYDPTKAGGDLHAVVKFGVRPQITPVELEGVPVTKLVREFSDEDVEADIQRRRDVAATVEPAGEGAAVGETDVAVVEIQPLDADGEPAGPVQRGAQILMATPDLRPELREALLGKTAGETFRVEWQHEHAHDDAHAHDHDDHTDRYRITVTDVQRRVLPEMDAEWVKAQTEGRSESLDDLRAEVRAGLEQSWERRAAEAMEEHMVGQFVDAHQFAVPESLVEASLDTRLDEMRERAGGRLPEGFDVVGWRERAREATERQVRWFLVKDALVNHEGLHITDEDLEAEFEKMAGDPEEVDLVKGYFLRRPEERERLVEMLLNRRVFESLGRRFTVVEKTRADLEREREERLAAEREAAEAEAATVEGGGEEKPKKGLLGRLGFGKKEGEE